jgi:hypothetical protein
MLDRDDSPWYPSARLFRQKQRGNWDQPIARLADALAQFDPHQNRAPAQTESAVP